MDMVLTGRILTAHEALSAGLVARVVAREAWLDEARRVAGEIAARAPVAQRLAREAVDRAFETGLDSGRAAVIPDGLRRAREAGEADMRAGYADDADPAIAQLQIGRRALQ